MSPFEEKNYEIKHVAQGNYLCVRPFSMLTRTLLKQSAIEADACCRKVDCQGYLYDMRGIPNVISDIENYQYVYREMDEMGLSRTIRSAILINEGEETHDFPEVLLLNAGYNVKIFSNEQEAIAWITRIG